MANSGRAPGPRGHWILGTLREFRQDMLAFYTRIAREYGDVVSFRLGPKQLVLLNHPDFIEQVLVTENRKFIKHYAFRLLRPTLGDGLVISEGDFWLRQRRLMQPAFSRQRIDGFGSTIVDYTTQMIDSWQPGSTRDLHADMTKLAMSIVTKTLLDVDTGDSARVVSKSVDVLMEDFNDRFQSAFPPPFWLPVPRNLHLKRHVRRLDAIILDIIRQRREEGRDRGDLLSMLVEARDEADNTGMTDKQLRDEVMTLFLAGHETTASALSWMWHLLARHPQVEARLVAELDSVLAGRPPTAADVSRLPYTEQVVLETLRLYPPAYVIGRQPLEDCTIGGYRVAAGTSVLISKYVTQRDPRFFERPDEFDPDRWNDGLIKRLPKYTYFPFGGGPRVCIGNTFAMLEAILVVAAVAQRFHFDWAAAPPVVPWPSITLRPRHGIHMVVRERGAGTTKLAGNPAMRKRPVPV
jgi:cytochrome P450